jgi:hypothetical protein
MVKMNLFTQYKHVFGPFWALECHFFDLSNYQNPLQLSFYALKLIMELYIGVNL